MLVMISQPMNGKSDKQIKSEREEITKKLEAEGYDVLDTLFTVPAVANPIYWLSKSIEAMSHVSAMYFMDGWDKARGCIIEHEVAVAYGIKIIHE